MAKNHRKDCGGFYPGDDVCYFDDPFGGGRGGKSRDNGRIAK